MFISRYSNLFGAVDFLLDVVGEFRLRGAIVISEFNALDHLSQSLFKVGEHWDLWW